MSRFISFIFLFFIFASTTVSAEKLVTLDTREGVQQKFLLAELNKASASLILFAGGKGALDLYSGVFGGAGMNWGRKNFLVRTRDDFLERGFNVAIVDAPSDYQGEKGMLYGFRNSVEHVQDIDAVITYLKDNFTKPVWLIGTSRGTESAANIALNTSVGIDGVIFTSSMTEENGGGISLPEMPLENIKVPALVTHHRDDGCRKTVPEGAQTIHSMLTGASVAEIKFYEGGYEESKPCKALSHHGYLGIEQKVLDDIADFIKRNS